jgi:uncharacterized LabA/DUF88 family protein
MSIVINFDIEIRTPVGRQNNIRTPIGRYREPLFQGWLIIFNPLPMSNSKVAILIDGGFFVQRFKALNSNRLPERKDVENIISDALRRVQQRSAAHCNNEILRTFYYDCEPFSKIMIDLNGKEIDYSQSAVFKNQSHYLNSLKTIDQFALRLGELSFAGWKLNRFKPKKPVPDFRQKGVDMKIGLDMAWMAGKRTVDKLVLVTGDSDFISPIKLVRREGLLVYLYTMESKVIKSALLKHADFIF